MYNVVVYENIFALLWFCSNHYDLSPLLTYFSLGWSKLREDQKNMTRSKTPLTCHFIVSSFNGENTNRNWTQAQLGAMVNICKTIGFFLDI